MALVRISEADRRRLEAVQRQIMENGTRSLQGLNELCPQCGDLMDGLRLEVSHVACSHCGYTESNARLSGVGAFALGALVGLGIAALAAQFLKAE